MAGGSRWAKLATIAAAILAMTGGIEMLLFQGAGGRIPHQQVDEFGQVRDLSEPLADAVWPLWTGRPLPQWHIDERFCCNLTVLAAPQWVAGLSARWQGIQFLPVVLFQAVGIVCLWRVGLDDQSNASGSNAKVRAGARFEPQVPSHLGIDQQQEGSRDCQQSQDAEAQPNRA